MLDWGPVGGNTPEYGTAFYVPFYKYSNEHHEVGTSLVAVKKAGIEVKDVNFTERGRSDPNYTNDFFEREPAENEDLDDAIDLVYPELEWRGKLHMSLGVEVDFEPAIPAWVDPGNLTLRVFDPDSRADPGRDPNDDPAGAGLQHDDNYRGTLNHIYRWWSQWELD